jgi:hypothetical protein
MLEHWKAAGCFVPVVVLLCAGVSEADTITVNFTVAGDNESSLQTNLAIDPVHGNDVATGSFSFRSSLIPPAGGVVDAQTLGQEPESGLGAEAVSFSWAGTSWTQANADVVRLIFDANGNLTLWQLWGAVAGLTLITNTDFPDIAVNSFAFQYSTPDSPRLGIFQGPVLAWSAGPSAPPVPEPTTMLLFASGLVVASVGRWRAHRQHYARRCCC